MAVVKQIQPPERVVASLINLRNELAKMSTTGVEGAILMKINSCLFSQYPRGDARVGDLTDLGYVKVIDEFSMEYVTTEYRAYDPSPGRLALVGREIASHYVLHPDISWVDGVYRNSVVPEWPDEQE